MPHKQPCRFQFRSCLRLDRNGLTRQFLLDIQFIKKRVLEKVSMLSEKIYLYNLFLTAKYSGGIFCPYFNSQKECEDNQKKKKKKISDISRLYFICHSCQHNHKNHET